MDTNTRLTMEADIMMMTNIKNMDIIIKKSN